MVKGLTLINAPRWSFCDSARDESREVAIIVHSIAIDSIVDYPIGMERFFGWDAKIKKVCDSVCVNSIMFTVTLYCVYCIMRKFGRGKVA